MRLIPRRLEDDVFERDETKSPVLPRLVHEQLGRGGLDFGVADERVVGVVDAHSPNTGVIDAGDPLCVDKLAVTVADRGLEPVELRRRGARGGKAVLLGTGGGRANERDGHQRCGDDQMLSHDSHLSHS